MKSSYCCSPSMALLEISGSSKSSSVNNLPLGSYNRDMIVNCWYKCNSSNWSFLCNKSLFLTQIQGQNMVFNATFNNISVNILEISFIGGGNRRIRIKPLTYRKSQTHMSFHLSEYFNRQWGQSSDDNNKLIVVPCAHAMPV